MSDSPENPAASPSAPKPKQVIQIPKINTLYYDHATPPEQMAEMAQLALRHGMEFKRRRESKEPEEATLTDILEDHVRVMRAGLDEIGAEYNPSTLMFRWEKQECTPHAMAQRIYGGLVTKKNLTKDSARTAMDTIVHRERVRMLEEARKHVLPHDPAIGDIEIRRFVGLMKDIADLGAVSHLDIAAIQSLIWQVKRKFAGHLKNEYPLMVIFSGGGGFGKSWTLERLFAPVVQWTAGSMRLEHLLNQFNMTVFNQYYVVPFEDMSPLTRNVREIMDTFKSVMTETHIAYRPPHERETHKLENHAACYGTTNFTVAEVLPDYTGARRWWEIQSPKRKHSEIDATRLKAIDFARLWQSVDGATAVSPLREHQIELTDVQNTEFKATAPLEDFFNDATEEADGTTLTQEELYTAVRAWFGEQGLRMPTKVAVFRYVQAHGSSLGVRATNTGNRPAYHGIRVRNG